jgi:hypothetical protein
MENEKPDATAKMFATIVELSRLLNVPVEDAVTLYMKIGAAVMANGKNKPQ